jgi:hypothetical protein
MLTIPKPTLERGSMGVAPCGRAKTQPKARKTIARRANRAAAEFVETLWPLKTNKSPINLLHYFIQ